jgi:tetratricopeptide (TPR) repeat protein
MLISYSNGYSSSIGWEVTTSAEVIKFPALTFNKGLLTHEIFGDKYLLLENYSGGKIQRNLLLEQIILGSIWLGLLIVLVGSSFLKRYGFFFSIALLALFINRLNLFEIGLFGINSKFVLGIPFLAFSIPLIYFNEYRKRTSFSIRLITLVLVSVGLWFGISNVALFTDHFIAHSLFSFAICGLIFLFIIAEEIGFTILFLITRGRGGKNNHLHFIALSVFYLGNLALYYLNKTGYFSNTFFFFDPFVLLAITSLIALWSLKFKFDYLVKYVSGNTFMAVCFGLGIILMCLLSLSMLKGYDAVYQSFHYLILYFHLGFGVFFLLYIIFNFIDPLIQGLEIYRIAFKERNFPYVSARLGGIATILGFFFLSGQEAYSLLRSGYYNALGDTEITNKSAPLAKEYYKQAAFLGYNNHYSNYTLGWASLEKGKETEAKARFERAASRYPSSFALINYGNLDSELNINKVQAKLEHNLSLSGSGEIKNNLGVLQMQKGDLNNALIYFEEAESSETWNQAPLLNKWNVFKLKNIIDTTRFVSDFENGNYGVKANILTTVTNTDELPFEFIDLEESIPLHRQAYLLNAAYLFSDDSIESLINKEIEHSINANINDRHRKALAIYFYSKGEVNKAFKMIDYLQSNAYVAYKGDYLDDLGKLAMDQGAYQLALDYFDKAISYNYLPAQIGKLEVLAALDSQKEIQELLMVIIEKDPGMTSFANAFLEKAKNYSPISKEKPDFNFQDLSVEQIEKEARKNFFKVNHLLNAIQELGKRNEFVQYEILVDAIEINPYSSDLLKAYILTAVDWNLEEYAEEVLPRLSNMISKNEYDTFITTYKIRKEATNTAPWE